MDQDENFDISYKKIKIALFEKLRVEIALRLSERDRLFAGESPPGGRYWFLAQFFFASH